MISTVNFARESRRKDRGKQGMFHTKPPAISPPVDSQDEVQFHGQNDFHPVESIVHMLGQPESESDSPPLAFEVREGEILNGWSSQYEILVFLGQGCFGQVAKCHKFDTCESVAVKIQKSTQNNAAINREVSMLETVSVLDPVKNNIVHAHEFFEHLGHTCLVFEMLDISLNDLMEQSDWQPFSLSDICPVTQQILVALDALKRIGVVHSDIKPDNIMVINSQDQSHRVKLIDFGMSFHTSEVEQGVFVQPVAFRAPEVALGLPYTEAIDMWGLGCVMALMYLGDSLFDGQSVFQLVEIIVHMVGQPDDDLLNAGLHTRKIFMESQNSDTLKWRLKTAEEFSNETGIELTPRTYYVDMPRCLDELIQLFPEEDFTECEDRKAFLSLLKGMLNVDGVQRLTPRQALEHPFTTMSHLAEDAVSFYLRNACTRTSSVTEGFDDGDSVVLGSSEGASTPAPQSDGEINLVESIVHMLGRPDDDPPNEFEGPPNGGSAVLGSSEGDSTPALLPDGELNLVESIVHILGQPDDNLPSQFEGPPDGGSAVLGFPEDDSPSTLLPDGGSTVPGSSEGDSSPTLLPNRGSAASKAPTVRTKKRPLQRVRNFFSKAFKTIPCCFSPQIVN